MNAGRRNCGLRGHPRPEEDAEAGHGQRLGTFVDGCVLSDRSPEVEEGDLARRSNV